MFFAININKETLIIMFSVLGLLILGFLIYINSKKHFQWYENYSASNEQPYGMAFIRTLLESYHQEGKFIFNDKKPLHIVLDSAKVNPNTSYIFIGESQYLNDEDADALLHFIDAGNDAFIASLDLPVTILNLTYTNQCGSELSYENYQATSVTTNFYNDTLHSKTGYPYTFHSGTEDVPYNWNVLQSAVMCDSTTEIIPLGYQQPDQVNFFKIPHGKGNLYIHTVPLVFTNYFLTKHDKAEYAAHVFSYLHGKNIIWDEYSKIPFLGNNNNGSNSPLYYILQQPSLKYAWWMLLVAILLYVVFASKRTQRIIPVLEVKTNTSLEYINMISALHYQNGNHLDMAQKKMKYFYYFIRARYGIYAQTFTDEMIARLADKSKVSLQEVQAIFNQHNLIERDAYYNIEDNRLINFYHAVENFYKHCK